MKTNNMKHKHALLSFEYSNSKDKITPFTFQDPYKVIIAQTVEEVLPSLKLIQEAVDSGYYAAGFLSYESAPAFDSAYRVSEGGTMPLLWFGIFSEPALQPLTSTGEFKVTEWKPSVSRDEYNQSIRTIKQLIENGDTYQTNYTIRLTSQFEGDEVSFFNRLKKAQASNYCAYINTGDHSILSASPELFFHLEGDQITTRPMKGTTKRGKSFAEDSENAKELYHSEKNRSENVMIVDLLRNDLGMIAEPSTVTVEKLFEIEQYPTVHQMTSTITAKVSEHTQLVDIFKALFPCGSITGAPKISTMNIITDLETAPREVYCGAIGYITPNMEAIFNVPIRTVVLEHKSGDVVYGVGGGITWDSTTEGEYHEILTKAKLLEEEPVKFQLLESLLLENGCYFLLDEHLTRLENSAQYFDFQLNDVKRALHEFSGENSIGVYKVRLLAAKDGDMTIESQPITLQETTLKVVLAEEPIDKDNPFLYHKTTNREIYTKFQKRKPEDVFDVLLWNEDGELTEFTNGNVVVEMDGYLWTPPVCSGLLAGTFRERLINTGGIHEKIISVSDLEDCTRIWFINSVRKWKEVQVIKKANR
ncbi:aminodeoxychorismate synthase component I [Neobacillus sp. FSL H8-0543]|uniref:aminodeoxychorismate synthase component I n=1 Tax=Neobacillus sp. FSL H8-0543 TaxID=2954672 RepID=UPI0031584C47